MDIPLSQHHSWKNTIVFLWNFLGTFLSKINWHKCENLFLILNVISLVCKSILMPAHYLGYHNSTSKFWDWGMWVLQLCYSLLRLFWIFWVSSIWALESTLTPSLQKWQLKFWLRLHWIYTSNLRSIAILTIWRIPSIQDIFPLSWSLFLSMIFWSFHCMSCLLGGYIYFKYLILLMPLRMGVFNWIPWFFIGNI